jgi:cell division control protein 6
MMNTLLKWEQTLFKDSDIFELGYVPEVFLYRETQMKSIGYAIAPGIEGKQPQNIICVGPPGTGKTTSFTKIIEQAKEIPASNLILSQVNCRLAQTQYSVLASVHEDVTGIKPPTSGMTLKKLYENVAETLVAKNMSLFVILDDADFLVTRKTFRDVVNNLLRLHEEYPVHVGLSTVHSTQCPLLDDGLTSVFIPTIVKFQPYTWDETYDILNTRAKIGLYPNVLRKELIEKITSYAVSKGDIRFGIDLMKRSVKNAEKRASKIVEFIDVDAALIQASNGRLKRYLEVFSDTEAALLNAATEMGTSHSGELFNEFNKRTKKGYTTFHKALNKLINAKLVDTYIKSSGKNGRTRIITAKQVISG